MTGTENHRLPANREESPPKTRWRTKKAIAEHFSISIRTVTNLMRKRVLPYSALGRSVRFDVIDCDKAVKALELKSVLLRGDNSLN